MTIITSMPAFLSRNYCCTKCNTGYDHKERHKCNNLCHACRKIHDEVAAKWLHCNECRQYFKGRKCFELHLATSTSGNRLVLQYTDIVGVTKPSTERSIKIISVAKRIATRVNTSTPKDISFT